MWTGRHSTLDGEERTDTDDGERERGREGGKLTDADNPLSSIRQFTIWRGEREAEDGGREKRESISNKHLSREEHNIRQRSIMKGAIMERSQHHSSR